MCVCFCLSMSVKAFIEQLMFGMFCKKELYLVQQNEWYYRQREMRRQSQALLRKWMALSVARNVGSREKDRRGGW